MTRIVALLQGINVGKRTIPMADLRALFEKAGATDVATYIQSGNVVFTHSAKPVDALRDELEQKISKAAGFTAPVMLRTKAQLAAIVRKNPYASDDPKQLHVAFLHDKPPARAFSGVDVAKFAPEEYTLVGRDIYFHLPNGMGQAKLPLVLSKQQLMTARNWNTVTKLLAMASAPTGA